MDDSTIHFLSNRELAGKVLSRLQPYRGRFVLSIGLLIFAVPFMNFHPMVWGYVADRLVEKTLTPAILGMWLAGGCISLAGAFANAELGTLFPHAGGSYVFAREGLGRSAGFSIGVLSFFAIYAGTVATLAAGLIEASRGLLGIPEARSTHAAVAVVVFVTLLQWLGTQRMARLNAVIAVAKLAAEVYAEVLKLIETARERSGDPYQ